MRLLSRRRAVPAAAHAALAAVTSATLLLSACGGSEGDAENKGKPTSQSKSEAESKSSTPPTATGSLEDIADESGCGTIDVDIDTAEVRQGVCKTDDGNYVLATFKSKKGQRDWLDASKPMAMGGRYLVGQRWVAVGDPGTVKSLRGRIGGEVEQGTMQHHAGSSSGGDEDGAKDGKEGKDGKNKQDEQDEHDGQHGGH